MQSTQWILTRSGIEGERLAMDTPTLVEPSPWLAFFDIINLIASFGYAALSAGSSILPYSEAAAEPTTVERNLSGVCILCELIAWISSVPWLRNTVRPRLGGTVT